jgi:hypothetical protein
MDEHTEAARSGAVPPQATEAGAVESTAPAPSTEITVSALTAGGAISVDRLAARLDSLEQRVAALEHRGAAQAAPPVPAAMRMRPAAENGGTAAEGAFSVLGRAMLGIAGAYLLRALAQADAGLRPAVGWAGILYALAWLTAAARARSGASFLQIAYASTSALILAPMLWELTLGFQVLSPAATAGALAVFVGLAFAFSSTRDLAPVTWIAVTAAAALALVLAIATHALLPFIVLLVLMVLLAEVAEERGCGHGTRVLAAAAADAALWIQIYLLAPANTRLEHPAPGAAALITPAVALFLVTGGSALVRAVLRRTPITVFEIFQATISFLLAAISLLLFAPAAGMVALPVACLALAAGLYAVSFTRFERVGAARNAAVFATWSAALLLAGLWMTLAEPWLTVALGSASVAATLGARVRQRLLLELHGAVYLAAAALAAGLAEFAGQALAGPMPAMPSSAVGFASACALLCAAAAPSQPDEGRGAQTLHLLVALAGAACGAALLVTAAAHGLALGLALGAHHLAFLRTLVLCGMALALAFAGPRLRRMELSRVGYATLALVAVKLVTEDLRHGHLAYSAGSIFLFAIALIAVPRVTRRSSRLQAKSGA